MSRRRARAAPGAFRPADRLLDQVHPGRVHFGLWGVGPPSRWNTLRALRVLNWRHGAA